MTRTEEAIEVLISHGYDSEAEILRQVSKSSQEVEPVAITAEFAGLGVLTLRLDEMDNELGMRILPETVVKYYPTPQDDKLRKAEEEYIRYIRHYARTSEESKLLQNLRTALEDK